MNTSQSTAINLASYAISKPTTTTTPSQPISFITSNMDSSNALFTVDMGNHEPTPTTPSTIPDLILSNWICLAAKASTYMIYAFQFTISEGVVKPSTWTHELNIRINTTKFPSRNTIFRPREVDQTLFEQIMLNYGFDEHSVPSATVRSDVDMLSENHASLFYSIEYSTAGNALKLDFIFSTQKKVRSPIFVITTPLFTETDEHNYICTNIGVCDPRLRINLNSTLFCFVDMIVRNFKIPSNPAFPIKRFFKSRRYGEFLTMFMVHPLTISQPHPFLLSKPMLMYSSSEALNEELANKLICKSPNNTILDFTAFERVKHMVREITVEPDFLGFYLKISGVQVKALMTDNEFVDAWFSNGYVFKFSLKEPTLFDVECYKPDQQTTTKYMITLTTSIENNNTRVALLSLPWK